MRRPGNLSGIQVFPAFGDGDDGKKKKRKKHKKKISSEGETFSKSLKLDTAEMVARPEAKFTPELPPTVFIPEKAQLYPEEWDAPQAMTPKAKRWETQESAAPEPEVPADSDSSSVSSQAATPATKVIVPVVIPGQAAAPQIISPGPGSSGPMFQAPFAGKGLVGMLVAIWKKVFFE